VLEPLLLALAAAATPHLVAVRTDAPPVIDGRVDDAVWTRAASTDAFTQKFPNERAAPSDRTTMRVLYDDDAIYIAFDCEETHSKVVEHLTRRDRTVEADRVELALGTRKDGRSAFQFTVNAAGVLTDAVLFNDTDSSPDWDENWDARAALTPGGWSVEIKIPLRVLRFESAKVQSWDLQARRYISERQEIDEWSYIPRDAAGEVSHYGKLDGLRDLRARTPIEVRPFLLGRLRRRDAATTQLANGTDITGSAGLDLKWHPTQSLTLDAAFNPDFAQVEADQQILNLTTYETYYPEKRPFFLEGIDTFATPRQLLYTRRIGRAAPSPNLRSDLPYGEQLVDVSEPARIYGASKLTGSLAPHWTVGTLQAVTGRNDVDVELANGTRQRRLIDPLTSFNVVRVKRELEGNGHVGALFTSTTRAEPTGDYPYVGPGLGTPTDATTLCPARSARSTAFVTLPIQAAPGGRCFNDAYVGSLDWRWRSPSGDWVTGGQAIATTLRNGPSRAVRDGTVIAPGDVGSGAYVYLNKEGGTHWVGDLQLEYEGKKLDYNDLGFNQRSNDYRWRFDGEFREMKPWWLFHESHAKVEYFGRTNTEGLWIGSGYQLNVSGTFKNFWQYFTEVHWRPTYYDDREIGDGTALQRGGLFGYELELGSNPAKPVSFTLESQSQWISTGYIFNATGGVLFRALSSLDLEVLPTVVSTYGEPRFAGQGAAPGQLLFGRLEAKSIGTTLRATYSFTPRLTLQTYGQLFLASGHYSDFSFFQSSPSGARPVVHLDALQPYTLPVAANPDFEEGILNLNVVLRWEYTLGSTIYLVYTRAQVPSLSVLAGESANLRVSAVGRAPAADVVLLKLTYFWKG
jgi:hypothetical protein